MNEVKEKATESRIVSPNGRPNEGKRRNTGKQRGCLEEERGLKEGEQASRTPRHGMHINLTNGQLTWRPGGLLSLAQHLLL